MSLPQNSPLFRSTCMAGCLVSVLSLLACGGANTSSTPGVLSEAQATPIVGRKAISIGWEDRVSAADGPSRFRATIPATQVEGGSAQLPTQEANAGPDAPAAPAEPPRASVGLNACPTSPAVVGNGATRLSVGASRASGVAPLSVFFDASNTVSSATDRPFHDIEYRWNFGETSGPGTAAWGQGSVPGQSSRNTAIGPLAAHVYETPGTYVVSVSDAANTAAFACEITVQDPEVVFAGAKTTCFSTSGSFSGCPAGANHVTTSDFAAVKDAAASSEARRLLLRRGEKWRATATANFSVQGPGTIGAFGAGARPIVETAPGFAGDAAVISFSSSRTPSMHDWRLMDVTIDGSPNVLTKAYGVGAMGGIDQLTVLRVNPNALRLGVLLSDAMLDIWNADPDATRHGHHAWDQLSIVDMDISNVPQGDPADSSTWSYGTYLSGERVFYAGNLIDGRGTAGHGVSHNARFTYLGKAILSHNTLMHAGPTEHSIKLHAAKWGDTGVSGSGGIGKGYTRWVVISDNKIVGAYGGWPVAIGPQDGIRDERGRDIVFERNLNVAGPATQWGALIWFSDVTVRNNIFNMSGALSHGGVWISQRASFQPPANRVEVYNNTFYSPDEDNDFVAVQLHPTASNAVVRNNLAFAPRDSNRVMIQGSGDPNAPLVESNNTRDPRTDPLFVGPLSTAAGFKLRGDSYAAGAGAEIQVYSDFLSTSRRLDIPPDLGSITH